MGLITIPGYIYSESEVLERRTDAHLMANGTVTAGIKYINDPDVRIDVIVVKKNANVMLVTAEEVMFV